MNSFHTLFRWYVRNPDPFKNFNYWFILEIGYHVPIRHLPKYFSLNKNFNLTHDEHFWKERAHRDYNYDTTEFIMYKDISGRGKYILLYDGVTERKILNDVNNIRFVLNSPSSNVTRFGSHIMKCGIENCDMEILRLLYKKGYSLDSFSLDDQTKVSNITNDLMNNDNAEMFLYVVNHFILNQSVSDIGFMLISLYKNAVNIFDLYKDTFLSQTLEFVLKVLSVCIHYQATKSIVHLLRNVIPQVDVMLIINTYFYNLIKMGSYDILMILNEYITDVLRFSDEILSGAIENKQVDTIEYLFQNGIKYNIIENYKWELIVSADVCDITEVLLKYNQDIELGILKRVRSFGMLRLFLNYKRFDVYFPKVSNHIFLKACKKNDLVFIKELLKYEHVTKYDEGLNIACYNCNLDTFNYLLRVLKLNINDVKSQSIEKLFGKDHSEFINTIYKNPRYKHRNNDLFLCCKFDKPLLAKKLIKKGIDPSFDKDVCIMTVCKYNYLDVLKVLLEDPRVNPSTKSNYCLERAIRYKNKTMFDILTSDKRTIIQRRAHKLLEIAKTSHLNDIVAFYGTVKNKE